MGHDVAGTNVTARIAHFAVEAMYSRNAYAFQIVLFLLLLSAIGAATDDIRIGVLEQQPIRAQQLAASVQAALVEPDDKVMVAPVEPDEPLSTAAQTCELAAWGASCAISGCGGATLAGAAAARAGLPLLLPDDVPVNGARETLALYPHREVMARVCAELCAAKGWRRAVLLHEGGAGGAALLAPDAEPLSLLVRQLPSPDEPALLRNLLLVLKKLGANNFIVWCDAECCVRVLDAAQRVGLLSDRHSYVLLSLDLHTLPLADFSHGGANVTGLRLFDPEAAEVQDMAVRWRAGYERLTGSPPASTDEPPPVALQLAFQAAQLAAQALRHLRLPSAPPAACDSGAAAFHADTLLNYLRSEEWACGEDAGGEMSWEDDGGRREVQLQVVELVRGGRLERAGRWEPRAGLSWQRVEVPAPPRPLDSMVNRTFTVLIAENKPYVMRQESTSRLAGNDRYEGFCIELIEKLADILNFNYTFVEQFGSYGSYDNVTGRWTGMIGRLIEDPNIDFAVTDLTITSEREKAVDFTTPFMNLGISILFRKPKPPEPKLFAFLLPFSNDVWICLGFAYLLTSLVLYVVGRLCHEEWQNPYPCIEEPRALENQFTLANALWFNLGAVLLQGSEIAPVAYGTRAVASAWWVFALVITSSYTANLATLLATKSTTEEIRNVRDLANNNIGINYGAKAGGSTYTFFQNSQNELYHKMYEHMREQTMPATNDAGILKVEKEAYAFLMESTTIDYVIERNCKVYKVGGLLDSKGYGIAMKKDSPFRQALNLALLNLQEAGTLREMTASWWKERNGGGACKDEEEFESQELRMTNFLGLFLVLAVGSALGIVVSCCDLAWSAARRTSGKSKSYASRFWAELCFVFRFEQAVKPLQGPLFASESGSIETVRADEERDSAPQATDRGSTSPRDRVAAGEAEVPEDIDEPCHELRPGSRSMRRRSSMHAASVRMARHAARVPRSPSLRR